MCRTTPRINDAA
jgi:transposase